MGVVTSVLPHLSEFEVSLRLKRTSGREHRRWLIIYNALVAPRPASEIALHTGVSVSTVHNVVSKYNRFGPQTIEAHEKGIRRRCYLNTHDEAEFVKSFIEDAANGGICIAGPIKEALETLLDHPVHHSTVYRMLHRNGWREIVPRPAHPQSDEVVQEAFKKTSLSS